MGKEKGKERGKEGKKEGGEGKGEGKGESEGGGGSVPHFLRRVAAPTIYQKTGIKNADTTRHR